MRRPRTRNAFTVVELLVALTLMGVATAGLVGALSGDRRVRDLAAAHAFAASSTRERLERLAVLPCSGGASGSGTSAWGAERWHALPVALSWHLTDSLVLRRVAAPVIIEARIACPD